MAAPVRIVFLHHSTGAVVWAGGLRSRLYSLWDRYVPAPVKNAARSVWSGGVPDFVRRWNVAHGTDYQISELTYPSTDGGYPWSNDPFDYWNLWVRHTGPQRDRGELNLDDLAARYDVIVFKHCFPVSGIGEDAQPPSVSSDAKTLANYKLQYDALKARLHQYPSKKFIVWTGPVLTREESDPDQARRARQFFDWVKTSWDEKGDNIHVWDFYSLEAGPDGFLDPAKASARGNAHPAAAFASTVAPLLARRIVDVVEGRGDVAPMTGAPGDRLHGVLTAEPAAAHPRGAASRVVTRGEE